jgi:lipopolysaccharide transport system ATP-binding protein
METSIFHLTHFKAGSQWISEVLKQAAKKSMNFYRLDPIDLFRKVVEPNSIYAPAYMAKQDFLVWTGKRNIDNMSPTQQEKFMKKIPVDVREQNQAVFNQIENLKMIKFFVIRDLRDSIISAYFSVRYSHVATEQIQKRRNALYDLSEEDGITYMIENVGKGYSRIQTSWLDTVETPVFRYEEFIEDELETFGKIMEHCEINIRNRKLRSIVENNSFSRITGRKPGQEDKYSHLRSGTKNNWKDHFTSDHIKLFKKLYGETLIQTGYEKDLNW